MHLDEARALLGLAADEPLAHDRVRRAYLRKLRLHPPERDPEGFQALRSAHDLLLRVAAIEATTATTTDAAATDTTTAAAAAAAAAATDATATDDPTTTADSATVTAEPSRQGSLTDLLARLANGDGEAAALAADPDAATLDDALDLSPLDRVRWVLTRELLPIATLLPTSVLAIVARAIADGDLASARPALEGLRYTAPAEARAAAAALRRAPTLDQAFAGTLAPRPRPPTFPRAWLGVFGVIAFMGISVIYRDIMHAVEDPRWRQLRRVAETADELRASTAAPDRDAAIALARAARADDCPAMRAADAALRAAARGPATASQRAVANALPQLTSLVTGLCGAVPTTRTAP